MLLTDRTQLYSVLDTNRNVDTRESETDDWTQNWWGCERRWPIYFANAIHAERNDSDSSIHNRTAGERLDSPRATRHIYYCKSIRRGVELGTLVAALKV